ncbi:MAG: FtsX-like permease family protein [Gemmatimonadaceae bacterium]
MGLQPWNHLSTTAYGVAQRSREFGIRIALGARRGDVLADVFRRVGSHLVAGVAVGAAGALAVGRVIQGLLYDVSAHHPGFYAVAAVALVAAACVAALGPGMRAARESPLTVMRAE